MFSHRTLWDQTPNRLAALTAAKRAAGAALIDLTESNPTAAGLTADDSILALLSAPAALRYEPDPRGLLAARAAVARDYLRRGATVDAGQILLTASSSEAYSFLFKALCDPGDEVLVPRPGYPLFDFLAGLENVVHRPYTLAHDGEWHLSAGSLAAEMTERTRAVVVVNPNNPTGSFLKKDEARDLQQLCAARNVAIIADEVFADFPWREDAARQASLAGAGNAALTFSLGGLSKSCGLPQLKLGWIAVSGPPALRDDALARLELVADTFLSVGTPVQHAASSLLAQAQRLQAPIRERVAANAVVLVEAAAQRSDVSLLRSEGGWYAVLRVPAKEPEEELVLRLLRDHDLLIHPGYFFDFPQEAFLVASLLPPTGTFREGCTRLIAAV